MSASIDRLQVYRLRHYTVQEIKTIRRVGLQNTKQNFSTHRMSKFGIVDRFFVKEIEHCEHS